MADTNSAENPEQYADQFRQEIHNRFRQRMDGRCRHRSGRFGIFAGVLLIVFGILFLLQNLGVPYFDRVWDFWPVILIVLGLGRIARGWGFGGRLLGGALIARRNDFPASQLPFDSRQCLELSLAGNPDLRGARNARRDLGDAPGSAHSRSQFRGIRPHFRKCSR
jgi:hypothetical protein